MIRELMRSTHVDRVGEGLTVAHRLPSSELCRHYFTYWKLTEHFDSDIPTPLIGWAICPETGEFFWTRWPKDVDDNNKIVTGEEG